MKKGLNTGLGRGLSALIPGYEENPNTPTELRNEQITELKIIDIEPNKDQPRKQFDKEQLQSLADSIAQYGLIQPIVVKKLTNGRYQIIAGERRWRASRLAGLKTIPVVINQLEGSDVMEVALIENLQRENLNAIEEALGYRTLMDEYQLTQEKISTKVGKSRSAIANTLRLLSLENEVKEMVVKGQLSGGHARCLVGIDDKSLQLALAEKIINEELSVRDTEQLIKKALIEDKEKPAKKEKDIYIKDVENKLSKKIGYKVQIAVGSKKNKIEIDYYNDEDLNKILKFLGLNN